MQLQKLIENSERQLKVVKELLETGKRDADTLDQASKILEKMSAGLGQSISQFQGTPIYEQALLKLQQENKQKLTPAAAGARFDEFQKQARDANLSDLKQQQEISKALQTAGPAFVPKLQAQVQLGSWRSNVRLSAQVTELLASIQELRNETRSSFSTGVLSELVKGSEAQNAKLREGRNAR